MKIVMPNITFIRTGCSNEYTELNLGELFIATEKRVCRFLRQYSTLTKKKNPSANLQGKRHYSYEET
jgi:hypothetical protein